MSAGQTVEHGGWTVAFEGMRQVEGPNYQADQARFLVTQDGQTLELNPEKRNYPVRGMVMTEACYCLGESMVFVYS